MGKRRRILLCKGGRQLIFALWEYSDISESKMVSVFRKLYADNANHVYIDFVKHLQQYLLGSLKTIKKYIHVKYVLYYAKNARLMNFMHLSSFIFSKIPPFIALWLI